MSIHVPVLAGEVKVLLNLKDGDKAIDATMGAGGHTRGILFSVGGSGRVLAIEQDVEMIKMFGDVPQNLTVENANFRQIDDLAERNGFATADAILFDLGISRWHFIESGRGFTFGNPNEPLIMNLDKNSDVSAASILNSMDERGLAGMFAELGEIRPDIARKLAREIAETRKKRKFVKVGDLLAVVSKAVLKRGKLHEATKIFQALRIKVNEELENLDIAQKKAFDILATGGHLAIISFHSLEDRIVKNYFRELSKNGKAVILTKKPVIARREEILQNPSARSAKLRVIEKI
ncbi:16S rRNA (cytosine(1402)-N(4))-methyltransferase [Candidatus Giovannonibacteria bacterium RIFCSPHIGHO2_02_43_13]|uniref:Ribosomal RNA small subunit methyltransferase H n=1 Tax=Candidatus Giovannonibacteria bacterium RIFCSPHIGHO2_02_43_13 TaxID=1798330 RepID=A0A1F5WRC1_9BACT|nr:MAG: Ribosomal RNA small subunit methyltransferase H [Parcubacteria group bacterium GW2011_GWA2_44_13]OGF74657.1 MAG: 16S rRNA (cytosine(1402)-N(4))-methyltransferase [Candidatus Giovannonibacteria bacterium RIFCSPHIGHO2_12_FULL_44_42]OGF78212.1 MAG: 16S rRNA (cytosine(1402)-N(4))-methyltransferase [Candidatus Giovannonibacteria bacterium RIFCSPHIGHO2_02_43_13]OGF90078.1 MAG: 16S rRNA (cytosine(1402)-N(4))-methyltransferase [Candidatus Giovannonibacteria bacterium RIFCSPLOWO2_02_FULL_43_54]O